MTPIAGRRISALMTGDKDTQPKDGKTQSEREKRLAEALRRNLKRRKAAKKPD